MKDHITIGIKNNIRVYVATTTKSVLEATKRHNLWPVATMALSRSLTITAIMGKMLKDKQKIVSIINGGGPLGTIMAESTSYGKIRGYVANPAVDLKYNSNNKLAVDIAVGKDGTLNVIKDLQLKKPFSAQIKIVDGTITNEFTKYFFQSEQTKTAIINTCLLDGEKGVVSSGAILFQLLPNYSENDVLEIENIINSTKKFSEKFAIKSHSQILNELINGCKILEKSDIWFECNCDITKMKNAILTLNNNDKKELIAEGKCEIKCQYCSEIKIFNKQELRKIFKM